MRVYYKQVQLNPTQETDYTDLANKPAINGVELEGDLSTEQIKVTWHGTQEEFDALPSVDPYTFYIIDDGIPVGMQESYLNLSDKPSINGQVLTGNKVSADLNMYTSDEVDNIIASMRAIKVVTALPAAPAVNTMYYVGPDSEGVYQVYLFDSLLNRIDLGPSVQKLYTAGNAIGINETTSVISVKYDGTTINTNTNNELRVPQLEGTKGHSIKPIYLDNGTIKEVTQVSSGAYNQGVPYIAGSVMNTGATIQMHQPTDTANDWANIQLDSTAGSVNLWNNNYNNVQKGPILTEFSVDDNSLKVNSTTHKVYLNYMGPEVYSWAGLNSPTFKGHLGNQYYVWNTYSGLQLRDDAPVDATKQIRRVIMTYVDYFSAGKSLGSFTLNTPEDSSYMTYLSGITYDGTAIVPSRTKMNYNSSQGRAGLISNPIFGTAVKYLTYHIDWTRQNNESSTNLRWVGKLTISTDTGACLEAIIDTTSSPSGTKLQTPILWFDTGSGATNAYSTVEIYRS